MNKIFFFTGTGNSLHIAKKIAAELGECEITAIHKGMDLQVSAGYERIGFVFPTYGWASPLMVVKFFKKAKFPQQNSSYFFAVTTCGGLDFNTIPQVKLLLKARGIKLNYGNKIRMFKNSVLHYKMSKKVASIAKTSDRRAISIIEDIKNKRTREIPKLNPLVYRLYKSFIRTVPEKALSFNVNDSCISCGTCKSVCPAKNIQILDGKPHFLDHCECCLSCIQHCPTQAINYNDKTQTRGRYIHPEIRAEEIANYYK
jgi:ferredoxin